MAVGTNTKKMPSKQVGPYKAVSSRVNSAGISQSGNVQAKPKPTPPKMGNGLPKIRPTNSGVGTGTYGTTGNAGKKMADFKSKISKITKTKGTPKKPIGRS